MALLGRSRAEVSIVNDDTASTPPDALPPIGNVEPPTDGGASGAKLDAGEDSRVVDLGGASSGFDSNPGSDAQLASGGPGHDSGVEGSGTAFGGGCSCSVAGARRGSAGMLLVLGAGLLGWARRRRR